MGSEGIRIGICDDLAEAVKLLEKLVKECLCKSGYNAEVMTFLSGQELALKAAEFDIVFLDIDMPEMDGIETGKIIHKDNEKCKIILATGREDRFKEAFKINAFRFISKPFCIREIEDALEDVWHTLVGMDIVELYENRVLHLIEQKEIAFFYAYDSYVEAVVGNVVMRKEISLAQLEETLDRRLFYRINRQYIVNMKYISYYQNGVINIRDKKLKVARARKKDFERSYREFDVRYRG